MRSLRRAYLPMMVAGTALLFYLALFILAGQTFGVIHLAGPGLILIIGLADAIHLQQKFDDSRALGHGVGESLLLMYRSVGKACVLTSVTTACGFLSLLVARHEEVFGFGLWCAIGVLTAYVTVIVLMPLSLIFLPGDGAPVPLRSVFNTGGLRKAAVPVTVLLVVLSVGVVHTRMDSSLEQELPESVEVVQNGIWFAEQFRGLDRIEVDLKADLLDPAVFALVERMQNELREFEGISGSRSYVDAIYMTLAPDVVETAGGPMLGIQALGSGGAFPEHLLNRDLNRACIVFYRAHGFGTEAYEAFRERVRTYAGELPKGGSMKLNGYFPMFYESTTLLSKTMAISLACSLGMITLILIWVLRSVKLALLCLVPNAIPLLVVAGISGWLGAPLHLGILIVFSVGLGLAVDDTIHLMVRFQQLQREKPGCELRELMDEAINSTGFAIALTSLVLLISALCFMVSSFTTMRWTGVTLGSVAVAALLADLIVLPWLIEKFHRPRSPHLTEKPV
jgi:predicted RND superfamily exporter protein